MKHKDYDKIRIMEFINKTGMLKRSKLTREGLARFSPMTMKEVYMSIDTLKAEGFIATSKERIPGRRGPSPIIYTVTVKGLTWLKGKRREVKKFLKELE